MRSAFLINSLTGERWSLVGLIEQHGEVSIGRGESNLIVLEDRTVSAQHATIDYRYGNADHGWDGQNYYIMDHSTNGTRLSKDDTPFNWDSAVLKERCELYFGNCGPLIFSLDESTE